MHPAVFNGARSIVVAVIATHAHRETEELNVAVVALHHLCFAVNAERALDCGVLR
eukprot:m.1647166 g.1647166  ORF g.1647166 m.1647166 type:complete len:55 (-) comp74195_c0_seq1:126-290(-)